MTRAVDLDHEADAAGTAVLDDLRHVQCGVALLGGVGALLREQRAANGNGQCVSVAARTARRSDDGSGRRTPIVPAGSGPEAGVRGGHGQPVSATCTLFGGHPRAVGVRIRSRGGVYGTARAVEGVQN